MKTEIAAQRKLNKNNTSGHLGIFKSGKDGNWYAVVGFQNKKIFIGSFHYKADAISAMKEFRADNGL
jgi:hypothetical protein